jgi:methylamine dehydrogenase light chain
MLKELEKLNSLLDRAVERQVRKVASVHGRRSFLSKMGAALVGTAVVPMLPFDRFSEANAAAMKGYQDTDQNACDYWRYCALSGPLCSCCGGGPSACPPGTEISKVSWIGTCENPTDKRHYLVSYNDCCGKIGCNQCRCHNTERDKPGYRMGRNSAIHWCMANDNSSFAQCTVALIVGLADQASQ